MDEKYIQLSKNSVGAKGQMRGTYNTDFYNPEGSGVRVLFVGNSITLHGVLNEIGWKWRHGMAASSKEKDYVHIMMKKIKEKQPDAAFCICNVGEWELEYKRGREKLGICQAAREFSADIIVMRFIENCPVADFDGDIFKEQLDTLLAYLNKSGKAKIIMSTGFWRHPGDNFICEYAKEKGYNVVELGDLGEKDEMKAIGLFEHEGVANHPGDLGMKKIGERLFFELEKEI